MPIFDSVLSALGLRSTARVSPMQQVGTIGTAIYGGVIQSNEKNSKLSGSRKYETFGNILVNTSIVAAGVRLLLNLVSKAEWKVEPSDDSAQAREIAEAVESILKDMRTPWHRVVRRAAMHKFYGFSVQEWTAKKRDDGVIGYLDIASRPQHTIEQWDLDDDGYVIGVVQCSPMSFDEVLIPRWKLFYMVDDALTDSPEGLGLLRQVAERATDLERFEQLEGWGFESDLRGIPVGRAPYVQLQEMVKAGDLPEADRDAMLQPLEDFVKNHIRSPRLGLLLDSITYETEDDAATPSAVKQWDLDVIKASGTSQAEIGLAIERKTREIARVLGVEHLLLGGDGSGSLAMAREKGDNFALIVDSTQRELEETAEKDVVGPLLRMNGWDAALAPKLKTEKLRMRSVTEVTGALKDMANAGAVLALDDPAIAEVRDLLGLSKPEMELMARDAALLPRQRPAPAPAAEPEAEDAKPDEGQEEEE